MKRLRLTPRRFVRDSEIHQVEVFQLSARQKALRRQQSIDTLVRLAGGSKERLAAAIEKLFQQQQDETQSSPPRHAPAFGRAAVG